MKTGFFLGAILSLLGFVALASTAGAADKVYVCHVTSSESNPVVLIYVSTNSVLAHLGNGDYILPEGQTSCDTETPPPPPAY